MMEWIISSCFLILVVLVLGKLLGSHVSAKLRYGLWLLVLIRLLVPVQLYDLPGEVKTARISPVMEEKSIYVLPMNSAPVEDAGSINAHVLPDGTVTIATSMGYGRLEDDGEKVVVYMDKLSPVEFFALVWKVGAVLFAVVLFGSNLRFALGLRKRRRPYTCDCPLPVYVVGGLSSPCLFGLLSPAIYLTEEVAGEESALRHVLTHEMTHYCHLDHLWSALRCAALAVHWWNPLVWLAVIVSKRDGELACDESALERLGEGERRAYGETLLTLVTAKTRPGDVLRCATTMTGSKKALLVRVKRIAKKQKQFLSAAILLVLVAALAAGCSFGKAQQDENAVSDNARRVVEAMFDTKNEELNYYLMMFMEVSPEVTDNGIISFDIQNYYDKWEAEIGDCFSPGTLEAVLRNYAIDAYHNLEAQGVSIELVDMERAFLDAKREEVLVTFTANGEENQVTVILRINTDGLFYRIELDPYPYDENLVIGGSLGGVAQASNQTTEQVTAHGVVGADTEKILRLIFSTDRSDLYYPIFPLADSDSTEEEKLAALEATRSVTEAWEAEIGEFLCDDSERWIHYWNNNLFIRYTQRHGIEYELLELRFVSGTDSMEKVDAIYRMDGIEYTTRFRFERDESGKVERFIYENSPPCPATDAE